MAPVSGERSWKGNSEKVSFYTIHNSSEDQLGTLGVEISLAASVFVTMTLERPGTPVDAVFFK